jgi:HEAT repeat protein
VKHPLPIALALFLSLLGLLFACSGEREAPPPRFELREVVAPRIAELEKELAEPHVSTPPADAADLSGLLEMIAGSSGPMRELAVEEATGFGEGALVQLNGLLHDEEMPRGVREAGIEVLGGIDSLSSARLLLSALENDPEAWVRTHCAWRLGEGTQDWTVPRLVLCLKYERDYQCAIWIGKALAAFDNYFGITTLITVSLHSPDENLRNSAHARIAEVLEKTGFADAWELSEVWLAGDPDERLDTPERSRRFDLEIWKRLGRFDEFQLRGVDDSRWILEGLDERGAAILAEALHDGNPKIRVHVAQCLERMGPRARVAFDTLLLGLEEPALAPVAANALGAIGDSAAELPLLERIDAPQAIGLRLAAVRALGHLEAIGEPTHARLRELLDNSELTEFRQAAGEGLLRLGLDESEVLPRLAELLLSDEIEPVSTEGVLREYLASRAEGDDETAIGALERWDALELPRDRPVTAEERRSSLEGRCALILEL